MRVDEMKISPGALPLSDRLWEGMQFSSPSCRKEGGLAGLNACLPRGGWLAPTLPHPLSKVQKGGTAPQASVWRPLIKAFRKALLKALAALRALTMTSEGPCYGL